MFLRGPLEQEVYMPSLDGLGSSKGPASAVLEGADRHVPALGFFRTRDSDRLPGVPGRSLKRETDGLSTGALQLCPQATVPAFWSLPPVHPA